MQTRLVSGSNGAHGANASAGAAVDAAASVDLHVIVAHGDSAHGAGGLTSAAGHAGIVDCMCHVKYTSIFRVRTILIVAYLSKKAIRNFGKWGRRKFPAAGV